MTRTCLLVLLGLSLGVFAQPTVTRGGALKKRQYQTYAPMTLYVDPTGSDSNSCTASAAEACATLDGAIAKLPRFIRHDVTVNVAAGAYAAPLPTFAGVNIAENVTLAVLGTMVTAVPATGSAAGTTTAATAGSSAGPATITHTGQTWTVNNLRGKFVQFTGGALSFDEPYPISANTATTLTFPSTISAGVGSTYTIVEPGSTFNSTAVSSIENVSGRGVLQLKYLRVSRTGATGVYAALDSTMLDMYACDIRSSTATGFIGTGSGTYYLTQGYIGSAQTGFNITDVARTPGAGGLTNSVVISTSGPAVFFGVTAPDTAYPAETSILEGGSTSSPIVTIQRTTQATISALWITCTGGASSVGFGTLTDVAASSTGSLGASSRITGCGTGIRLAGRAAWSVNTTAFSSVTTAFSVSKGATLDFGNTTPTFTTVTNELQLGGVNYTFAFLNGLVAPKVITDSYGSTIIR